jgi:hypothetical protein
VDNKNEPPEKVTKPPSNIITMNAIINNMTVAQLKEQLSAKNIKFSAKMKREALVVLLENNQTEKTNENSEFPEANAIQPAVDPMDKAFSVIKRVIGARADVDTLTRGELLTEVTLVMGEEFVQQNRKQLVQWAVEEIKMEMERRLAWTTNEPVAEPVEEPVTEVDLINARNLLEGIAELRKQRTEKKVRKQKTKKTAVEPETTDAPTEEPAKKVRKQKVKEPVPEPINFEEMPLNAIREYMIANGLDKQLVKLDAVFAKLTKTKKKEAKPRAPSVFNLFMKEEMASLKEQNPDKNHRELFSMASSIWKTSSKNPKNQQEE